jgi:hypothetical protein
MNDSNNRRVTSVNMPQRPNPWRGVAAFAGVAAIAGIALVAVILGLRGGQQAASPTATATATVIPSATSSSPVKSSPPTAGPTYQSQLGYSVLLPSGWRRSELQSRMSPNPQGDPDLLGVEVFTTRTPADEADAMRRADTGIGPAQVYTAGLVALSVDPTTVDGHAAAKTTFKFATDNGQSFYTVYVQDGDHMWAIGYTLAPSDIETPAGATEPAVRGIVESFKFAR